MNIFFVFSLKKYAIERTKKVLELSNLKRQKNILFMEKNYQIVEITKEMIDQGKLLEVLNENFEALATRDQILMDKIGNVEYRLGNLENKVGNIDNKVDMIIETLYNMNQKLDRLSNPPLLTDQKQ